MGMYDHIHCEYPLPDAEMQEKEFQTKDLENLMDYYTITKEGLLIHHVKKYELVPEEERPYYGTEDWDKNPLVQAFGMLKSIPVCDKYVDYNGDLIFYDFKPGTDDLIHYKAEFRNGQLVNLVKTGG